jgi:hypothetical protein
MKKIKHFALFALLTVIYGGFNAQKVIAAESDANKEEIDAIKFGNELAHVSIMPFEDRTNTKYFQYMAESLGEAINASMIKEFSYNRTSSNDMKKALFQVQQEALKNKIKKKEEQKQQSTVITPEKDKKDITKEIKKDDTEKGTEKKDSEAAPKKVKTEEQLRQDEEQLDLVKEVAEKLKSDIVIYGNYSYDDDKNELVFTVLLYLSYSGMVKELDEQRNALDNTLFNATKEVAQNLSVEIHTMIEEADRIAALKKGETVAEKKEDPIKPGEKVALTRKVAMLDGLEWIAKKFSMTLSPGFFINLQPASGTGGICGTCLAQVALNARLWVLPRIYLGAKLDFGEIWSPTIPLGNAHSVDALALLGLGIPAGRWLFSADAGAGYFLLLLKSAGAMYNPAFGARVGVEFLVTPGFSISLNANGYMYYDKPKPLLFGGLALTFNYVL